MCKRKNSETAATLHEQCTPKRPRWIRLSFSKSPATSCTPFLHSSLSTHLAKPEPSSLADQPERTTPHHHEDIMPHSRQQQQEEILEDQDSETDQDPQSSCPSSPESSTSTTASSLDSEDDLDDLLDDDELIAEAERSPSGLKMLLLPSLSYRAFNGKIILSTTASTTSARVQHQGLVSGHNFHHPDSRRSRQPATRQNHGWNPKSGHVLDNDAALASVAIPTSAEENAAVQMWVCCACESDNGGDVVWCSKKSCNHYTVNCLDCFSY